MNPLPPSTRRANRWLFTVLVIFAIALAVVVFLWMQRVVRANGGIADPQRQKNAEVRSQKAEVGNVYGRLLPASTSFAFAFF